MKIKIKSYVGSCITCIGFLVMLGTVGGIECDTINLTFGIYKCAVGLLIFAIGLRLGNMSGWVNNDMPLSVIMEETNYEKNKSTQKTGNSSGCKSSKK